MELPILSTKDEPVIRPMAYECKFTLESRGGVGGDWERNVGGMQGEKRVTFDGYASEDLYAALIDMMGKVMDA